MDRLHWRRAMLIWCQSHDRKRVARYLATLPPEEADALAMGDVELLEELEVARQQRRTEPKGSSEQHRLWCGK